MGDVVSFPISLDSDLGRQLVVDCARFRENLLDEKAIRKKYRMAESDWEALAENDALIRAIEEESLRRVRDGSCKKEKAQALVVKAPEVAASIMNDVGANARHRLDACRVLDDFSATGPQGAPASDRFQIVINLGADLDGKPIVEKYDRSIEINPNDHDRYHPDDRIFPAIMMKKDGGNGEPV